MKRRLIEEVLRPTKGLEVGGAIRCERSADGTVIAVGFPHAPGVTARPFPSFRVTRGPLESAIRDVLRTAYRDRRAPKKRDT
jgi:hypothetical protein